MLRSEQEIYIYETEEKPNRFAMMALLCCDVIIAICWLLDGKRQTYKRIERIA